MKGIIYMIYGNRWIYSGQWFIGPSWVSVTRDVTRRRKARYSFIFVELRGISGGEQWYEQW